MAYEVDKDKCLKKFGKWDIGGQVHEIKIQQYNGGEPKLVIATTYRGQETRVKGMNAALVSVLVENKIMQEYLKFCAEALEIVPLEAEQVA